MAKIKEGDFIELEFTGKIADTEKIFDTTDEELAKEEGIHSPRGQYGSVKIVVGEQHVVPGLDKALEGAETGKHDIKIEAKDAFGKKHAELLKIIRMKEFRKQGVKPFVGLEVQIDGQPGVVRTVSGGRIIVDFNHPLAGKDIEYEINVKKIIEGDKPRLEAVLELMNTPYKELKLEGKKATITMEQEIPDQLKETAETEIERLTGLKAKFNTPEKNDSDKEKSENSKEEE